MEHQMKECILDGLMQMQISIWISWLLLETEQQDLKTSFHTNSQMLQSQEHSKVN